MIKLNIGSGWNKRKGFLNIDIAKEVKPDMILNIENGLPFKDNSVSEIYSEHCLEHVRPEKWKFVINEMIRISTNGCLWHFKLPYDNSNSRCNIDHYRTFNYYSFSNFETGMSNKDRSYYFKQKMFLDRLNKQNIWITRFYTIFPYLKYEIEFKYHVRK